MGPSGRWKKNLINKCLNSGKPMEEALNDFKISPKVRQLLQVCLNFEIVSRCVA
jgi:hypothetical protein